MGMGPKGAGDVPSATRSSTRTSTQGFDQQEAGEVPTIPAEEKGKRYGEAGTICRAESQNPEGAGGAEQWQLGQAAKLQPKFWQGPLPEEGSRAGSHEDSPLQVPPGGGVQKGLKVPVPTPRHPQSSTRPAAMQVLEERLLSKNGEMPIYALGKDKPSPKLLTWADIDADAHNSQVATQGPSPFPLENAAVFQVTPKVHEPKVLSERRFERYQKFIKDKGSLKAARQIEPCGAEPLTTGQSDVMAQSDMAEPPKEQSLSKAALCYSALDKLEQNNVEDINADDVLHAAAALSELRSECLPCAERRVRHRYVECCKATICKAISQQPQGEVEESLVAAYNSLVDGYGK